MTKLHLRLAIVAILFIGYWGVTQADSPNETKQATVSAKTQSSNAKTAVFAGGCFWCIEADFEKLEGVYEAISGYTGGAAETANYKTVTNTETGHYEAVEVRYDPTKVSYSELLEYFWRHIDPTDPNGQFCDKGSSYRSAIFYANAEEKSIVDTSLAALNKSKPFKYDIVTAIEPAKPFYRAEEYHQDYYKKSPFKYRYYRNGCGRDKTVKALWNN